MTKDVTTKNDAAFALANKDFQGIAMPGLEHMEQRFIPIPRIKLVQSNSNDVQLADGNDARKGSFYYENFQQSQDELHIALLGSKLMSFTGPSIDDPTVEKTSEFIGLIFLDLSYNKVFTMRFSPGSFRNWSSLVGQFMAAHEAGEMATTFSKETIITTELMKDGSRSWYVLRFQIGKELDETTFETASALYEQYSNHFNRVADDVEEAV